MLYHAKDEVMKQVARFSMAIVAKDFFEMNHEFVASVGAI